MVSIIIPIFNAEPFLEECLASVRSQLIADWECLLVDDGSTDGSGAICDRWSAQDQRFRVLHQPNRGVSQARNLGIEQARGQWLFFCDADDMLLPYTLQRLLEAADGCDIAVGKFRYGKIKPLPTLSNYSPQKPLLMNGRQAVIQGLYQNILINSPCGALFKRQLFDGPDTRFRSGIRYEDLDWFYRLYLNAEKVAVLPEVLYLYRKHSGSFVQRFSTARLDALDVTDRIVAYMQQLGDQALVEAALSRQFAAHCNMLLLLRRHRGEMSPELYRAAMGLCLRVIRSRRLREMLSPHARPKNRLGALLSLLLF